MVTTIKGEKYLSLEECIEKLYNFTKGRINLDKKHFVALIKTYKNQGIDFKTLKHKMHLRLDVLESLMMGNNRYDFINRAMNLYDKQIGYKEQVITEPSYNNDENDMEKYSKELDKQYQFENRKTIKLTESQFNRLFEDVYMNNIDTKNKKVGLTYNKYRGVRNKGNLNSFDMLKTDKMDTNDSDTYEVPLKGGIISYNITSINGTEVMHYFKRHFAKQKTYIKFSEEEYELEMQDNEFRNFMEQFLNKISYVVQTKINEYGDVINGISILPVPSSSNFNIAMAERIKFNNVCGFKPNVVNKDLLIKNLSKLEIDNEFIDKNNEYYNSRYSPNISQDKTHMDSVNKEYNRFKSINSVIPKIEYANNCANALIKKYYSRKEVNSPKFYEKLNELFLEYNNAVDDIRKSAEYFDTLANKLSKPRFSKIAKAIKYSKGPSIETRTNEIKNMLKKNGYLKNIHKTYDVCLWEPEKFQIKNLGNDVRMALKNYFTPNDNNEMVNNEVNNIKNNIVVIFDDNVSGGATLSDICLQLQNLGVEYIVPITFGKMRESWNVGTMTINKPKQFNF